jgi:hypothetical protein
VVRVHPAVSTSAAMAATRSAVARVRGMRLHTVDCIYKRGDDRDPLISTRPLTWPSTPSPTLDAAEEVPGCARVEGAAGW